MITLLSNENLYMLEYHFKYHSLYQTACFEYTGRSPPRANLPESQRILWRGLGIAWLIRTCVTAPREARGRQQEPIAVSRSGAKGITMLRRIVVRICAPTSAYLLHPRNVLPWQLITTSDTRDSWISYYPNATSFICPQDNGAWYLYITLCMFQLHCMFHVLWIFVSLPGWILTSSGITLGYIFSAATCLRHIRMSTAWTVKNII